MRRLAGPFFCSVTLFSLAAGGLRAQASVASPDGRNRVTVEILDGHLAWRLSRDNRPLVNPSLLGIEFQGAPPGPYPRVRSEMYMPSWISLRLA